MTKKRERCTAVTSDMMKQMLLLLLLRKIELFDESNRGGSVDGIAGLLILLLTGRIRNGVAKEQGNHEQFEIQQFPGSLKWKRGPGELSLESRRFAQNTRMPLAVR